MKQSGWLDEVTDHAVSIDALVGGHETACASEFHVNKEAVRETLQTALFVHTGTHNVVFIAVASQIWRLTAPHPARREPPHTLTHALLNPALPSPDLQAAVAAVPYNVEQMFESWGWMCIGRCGCGCR